MPKKWNIPEDSLFSFTTFRSLKEIFFFENFSISKNHIIWGWKLHPCQGSMKFEQVLFPTSHITKVQKLQSFE
jgi:hypothetical protein